ncbi:MAG: hypothetical protein Hals2KO_21250 [Halioglobus sp.]
MNHITLQLPDQPINIVVAGDTVKLATKSQEVSADTLEWSDTLLDGESVTYEKAEKAVKKLGKGWRLPTRKELESLVDTSRHDPAIDTEKFPDTKSKYYWTCTPCAWDEAAVWVVYFGSGFVSYNRRVSGGCVRAVRSGQ